MKSFEDVKTRLEFDISEDGVSMDWLRGYILGLYEDEINDVVYDQLENWLNKLNKK